MPHTRLVLFNVYVRTIMQFGAPDWSPPFLDLSLQAQHATVRPLLAA